MLKSYASFLKFLGHKLQGCADKMLSQEALLLFSHHKTTLETRTAQMLKMWPGLNARQKTNAAKKREAAKVSNPDVERSIMTCMLSWNTRERHGQTVDELMVLHAKATDGENPKRLTEKEFNTVAAWTHGLVAMNNAGRKQDVGNIKNEEWASRRDVRSEDGAEVIGTVVGMPAEDERRNKTGRKQDVFVVRAYVGLVDVWLDVREAYFEGRVSVRDCRRRALFSLTGAYPQAIEERVKAPDSPLFCTAAGGRLKGTSKAVHRAVAQASGLEKVTANTIRQSATTNLKANAEMAPLESRVSETRAVPL